MQKETQQPPFKKHRIELAVTKPINDKKHLVTILGIPEKAEPFVLTHGTLSGVSIKPHTTIPADFQIDSDGKVTGIELHEINLLQKRGRKINERRLNAVLLSYIYLHMVKSEFKITRIEHARMLGYEDDKALAKAKRKAMLEKTLPKGKCFVHFNDATKGGMIVCAIRFNVKKIDDSSETIEGIGWVWKFGFKHSNFASFRGVLKKSINYGHHSFEFFLLP